MEIKGKEKDPRLGLFARGEYAGGDFVYAGVFFNHEEDYLNNLAGVLHKIINKEQEAFSSFESFLKNKNHQTEGQAIYPREDVVRWIRPFRKHKKSKDTCFYRRTGKDRMSVMELRVSPPSDMEKSAGLVFVRLKGYEDQPLSSEVVWRARRDLIDIWLSLTEDEEVKDYLQRVKGVMELLEEALPSAFHKYPFFKLVFYLFPINFDRFMNAVVVSRASLYFRKEETKKNLWSELLEDMGEDYRKDLEYVLKKEGKSLENIRMLLDEALSEERLKSLRKDWKRVLRRLVKGESDKVLAVFMGNPKKEDVWVSFGEFCVPDKEINLWVFAEREFELQEGGRSLGLKELLDLLQRTLKDNKNLQKYIGNITINLKRKGDGSPYRFEDLFGREAFLKLLKGDVKPDKGNVYKPGDSKELLYSLCYFSARLARFIHQSKETIEGILLLLDTELKEDEGRYPLWPMVNHIYEYYGLPVQTITKRFFRSLLGEKPEATIKNMVISLYKGIKTLRFEFDGFHLPEELTVYAVIERPSPKFFYRFGSMNEEGERHGLYEAFRIKIKGKQATVHVEDKFILLSGGYGGDGARLEKWIREKLMYKNVRFCLITAVKDSYLASIEDRLGTPSELEGKLLFIRYDELKTAYLSDKAQESCYVVYTQEMNRLMERLGIKAEKDVAAIAIKPAEAKRDFEDSIYHAALQIFFTEKIGWSKEEVYAERKSLFIFTLIALSMYESESFATPYSKLPIWSKERGAYLRLERDLKEYLLPLRALLYEMLYTMAPLPGYGEVS
ncbi:MAG: hypothetical protein NZ827_06675 [Aquificaceae bacterium]|nr:hypothetical protein [Aquificaceae bacterium]